MLTIEGIYKDGKIELLETVSEVKQGKVLITFLENSDIDLQTLGPDVPVDTRQLDYFRHRSSFTRCSEYPDLLNDSKRVVRELGLSYGGVDWAVDSTGAAHSLECNPLGSFKWFEICSEEDITARLVSAISKRCA